MPDQDDARVTQWIVQGPDVASGKVGRALAPGGQVQQVQQVASDTLVLSMTADGAERLRAEFPGLLVEPNSSLEPFR